MMGDELLDESNERLPKWLKEPKDAVWYEYDLGDSWMHEIKLEKFVPKEPKTKYPRLLDGARARPEEDCGGIWGYDELCKILANPKHEDHNARLDWLGLESGDKFDPELFEPTKVRFHHPKRVLQGHVRQFK